MNQAITIFLRLVVIFIGIAVFVICVLPLPQMIAREAAKTPETAWQIYLFLVGAYLQAALFLFALYQGFKLLGYVDSNKVFSRLSVRSLRAIKFAAISFGLLMVLGIAWVMFLSAGTGEDAAGPVMIGLIGAFASSVVASVVAVLQMQVQEAIDTTKSDLPEHQN